MLRRSMQEPIYTNPDDTDCKLSIRDLKKMDNEDQKEVMKFWFSERYEDPVHHCPYDGREGGYQYIYGGPYETHDVLSNEFSGIISDNLIEEVIDELDDECSQWSSVPTDDFYGPEDFYDVDAALELANEEPFTNLKNRLYALERLLNQKEMLDANLQKLQRMMIFSFCITSLESFLFEIFSKKVFASQENKEKYLQNETNIGTKKYTLAEIYKQYSQIDNKIKVQIVKTSFHDLGRVKELFQAIGFQIGDISELIQFVNKRHDFVHRGGKNKAGEDVDTNSIEIKKLIQMIETFCKYIDCQSDFLEVKVEPS